MADVSEPDIGFQAGFGFYLGIVVTGIAAIAGLVAGASTATLLGVLPSALTAVAVVGHILAKRAHGLPERIGRSRTRRLACYLPPVAFAAAFFALPEIGSIEATGRFVIVTAVLVLLTGVSAFGLERMSWNRYVEALAADDPTASWTYHRVGLGSGEAVFTAFMGLVILAGILVAWLGNARGLVWTAYGLFMFLSLKLEWGGWSDFDPGDRWNPPTLRAHEAGIVLERPFARKLVRWDAIEGVELTDEALVLERRRFGRRSRWFDIRCDRAAMDDPEAVLEGIERARKQARARRSVAGEFRR